MAQNEYPELSRRVPLPDSTQNFFLQDVAGNKEDSPIIIVGNDTSLMGYVKGVVGLVASLVQERLVCVQNYPSMTTIDGVFRFAASLIDNDSGAIPVGSITPGTYDLVRDRAGVKTTIVAGGAFSEMLGSIYIDITFDDATWNPDDVYILEPKLDTTVVIGGNTYYAPLVSWAGLVSDLSAIETKIDTLISDMNVPGIDAGTNTLMRDVIGNKSDTAGGTSLVSLMRQSIAYVDTLETRLGNTATDSSFNKADDILEQDLVTVVAGGSFQRVKSIWLDFVNLTQNTVVKVYAKIDGGNYRCFEQFTWVSTDPDGVLLNQFTIDEDYKVSVQSTVLETAVRNIPYKIVKEG